MYVMRRTTVYLHDVKAVRLKRAANKCGRSEAELIRAGIDWILANTPVDRPRPSLFVSSGDPTWIDRTDEILAEGFGADGYDR